MKINKIVIANGIYQEKELRLLVSFAENDKPIDVINLEHALLGTFHIATVEKVLSDIDSCILKLDCGEKAFIENKKLQPDFYIERHSKKKLVCQGDKFYISITQDKKGPKPYSCDFIKPSEYTDNYNGFFDYYISNYADENVLIITDLNDFGDSYSNIRFYNDNDLSLWELYGLTKIIDSITSRVVYLKSGANIIVEPTEAMTIIDVNSSKNYGKSTAYETNVEALKEIAYQLRLRAISGIIIIDLLKVSKNEEKELIELAKEFFKTDFSIVCIHGFTNLGLLEITRSRNFAPFKF